MTGSYQLFSTYSPCAGNVKVKIADGSLSSMLGKENVQLSNSVILESVLYVPNLSCNLLSISQLTKDLNCCAKFLSTHCVFQDLSSGKTIGSAKKCEGLYFFDEANMSRQTQTAICDSVSVARVSEIMLWHFRMGNPSIQYLKHLFPYLFLNKKVSDFQCEICQLVKHQCTSFPKSNYQPSKTFAMIHSDV